MTNIGTQTTNWTEPEPLQITPPTPTEKYPSTAHWPQEASSAAPETVAVASSGGISIITRSSP